MVVMDNSIFHINGKGQNVAGANSMLSVIIIIIVTVIIVVVITSVIISD